MEAETMPVVPGPKRRVTKPKVPKVVKNIRHKVLFIKHFLNLAEKESDALIHVKIKANSILNQNKSDSSHDLDIRITDCNEEILLHGSLKAASIANSLFKLNALIDALTETRDYINGTQSGIKERQF